MTSSNHETAARARRVSPAFTGQGPTTGRPGPRTEPMSGEITFQVRNHYIDLHFGFITVGVYWPISDQIESRFLSPHDQARALNRCREIWRGRSISVD
jgi:hypothetical protein